MLYFENVVTYLLLICVAILVFIIIRELHCAYKQHKALMKKAKELEQTYERYNNESNS